MTHVKNSKVVTVSRGIELNAKLVSQSVAGLNWSVGSQRDRPWLGKLLDVGLHSA